MKKFLIIGYCLYLVGCSNQANHRTDIQSIHPLVRGFVKQQGQGVANAQISLTSSSCDKITAITDNKGQFNLEQYCQVITPSIAIMDTVVNMSYPFDITIVINGKSYMWPVIDPYNISVEFDLSEQTGCITTTQEKHCTHLVLSDSSIQ